MNQDQVTVPTTEVPAERLPKLLNDLPGMSELAKNHMAMLAAKRAMRAPVEQSKA